VRRGNLRFPGEGRVAAVLDVGTRKLCCLVARIGPAPPWRRRDHAVSHVRILGIGHLRSEGVDAGRISDLELAERAIRDVVAKAERAADVTLEEVYVTGSFGPLASESFTASAPLANGTVGERDLGRVMDAARHYAARSGWTVLHTVPVSYSLGALNYIRDPRGMIGDSLKVDVHSLSAHPLPLKNMELCIERCHLSVAGVGAAPYAAGLAVLSENEAEVGATVIDMGAGATGVAVFSEGRFIYGDVIPMGGAQITIDIARTFSIGLAEAERLKTLYGSVFTGPLDHRDTVACALAGEEADGHYVHPAKAELSALIRARLEYIFGQIRERLEMSGAAPAAGQRLVATGGGSELLGVAELAAKVFNKTARIGRPRALIGLPELEAGPAFASAIGLILHLIDDDEGANVGLGERVRRNNGGYFARVGQWLRESF
jgi:cell division protein FtsA